MKFARLTGLIVLVSFVLAACAQAAAPVANTPQAPTNAPLPPSESTPTPVQVPAAVQAAREALAKQLGVAPESVFIHTSAPAEWPDSCLGRGGPAESCAAVITPGYGGLFMVDEVQYEFRVDESGELVRFIPGAALSARQVLVQQLQLGDLDAVWIASFEQVEWPDACLGISIPDVMCAEVITPGYRVVLTTEGREYVFHTDLTGGNVLLAEAPEPQVTDVVIEWQGVDGACQMARIGLTSLAFGPCNGVMMEAQFGSEERVADIAYFAAEYATFSAETPAGRVTFTGQGERLPTPAEQRMIAEWARLVTVEASGGRSGAAYGLAFSWHREGGIAGFCDDLAVYVTGEALASSCKGSQPQDLGRVRLTADQLDQLYRWVDSLAAFEWAHTDKAVADSMTLRLVFSGTGQEEASDEARQAILDFASQVYFEAAQDR